jgi:hypothetical protein
MSRAPQWMPLQWYVALSGKDQPWRQDAACGKHLRLPWTSEREPHPLDMRDMRAVCESCPVRRHCAAWALYSHSGNGAAGGEYARVWVPWRICAQRRMARRQLRVIAAGTQVR